VVKLSALATLLPEKKLWFSLSWRLGGRWSWSGYFGEEIFPCSCQDLPVYILVSVLTLLSHTDLKIIQKYILQKLDWKFGLDVFD